MAQSLTHADTALPADWRDLFALTKPRVMSLVVFTALCGLLAAPGDVHPVLAFSSILAIALGAGALATLGIVRAQTLSLVPFALVFGMAMVLLMIWRPRGLIGHLCQLIGLAHAIAVHLVQAVGRAAQTQPCQQRQGAKGNPEGDDDAAEVLNDFDVLEHVQPVICLPGGKA